MEISNFFIIPIAIAEIVLYTVVVFVFKMFIPLLVVTTLVFVVYFIFKAKKH
jgi:hypothetical protein